MTDEQLFYINDLKATFSTFSNRDFRPNQAEAINAAINSNKSIVVIQAPTGSGKSLIGACIARHYNNSTYLCHSKTLQTQLERDFPGVSVIFGRSNYQCGQDNNLNAAECTPTRANPCRADICDYQRAKSNAVRNQISVLNYSYAFTEMNHVGQFSGRQAMICDEADVTENELTNFISLTLSDALRFKYKLRPFPFRAIDSDHKIKAWEEWFKDAELKIDDKLHELNQLIDTLQSTNEDIPASDYKERKRLQSLMSKLQTFQNQLDLGWILDIRKGRSGETFNFEPVWLTQELASQYWTDHSTKLVLMSATLPPLDMVAQILGLPASDIEYITVPSSFDPAKSPIYYKNVWDGRRKSGDDPKLIISAIKDILQKHAQHRGIIHTVNYSILNIIRDNINDPRLIFHNSTNREQQLNHFLSSQANHVLVSPSMNRGISLEDDRARFSILCKTPFMHVDGKKITARRYKTPKMFERWYVSQCAQDLIQTIGRGVRSQDDWCENYFLDSSTQEFVSGNSELFSPYFLRCLRF